MFERLSTIYCILFTYLYAQEICLLRKTCHTIRQILMDKKHWRLSIIDHYYLVVKDMIIQCIFLMKDKSLFLVHLRVVNWQDIWHLNPIHVHIYHLPVHILMMQQIFTIWEVS